MHSTFLHLPRENWRIRKVGTREEDEILPGERPKIGLAVQQSRTVGVNTVSISPTAADDEDRLDLWISGKTSLKQIVNYVSRLLWWRHKRVKDPNAYKKQALEALIRRDQGKVKERLLENKFRCGVVTQENGIYFLSGQNFTRVGKNSFPILLPNSSLVYRLVQDNQP